MVQNKIIERLKMLPNLAEVPLNSHFSSKISCFPGITQNKLKWLDDHKQLASLDLHLLLRLPLGVLTGISDQLLVSSGTFVIVIVFVVVMSTLLKRHSKATCKRRAPAYSRIPNLLLFLIKSVIFAQASYFSMYLCLLPGFVVLTVWSLLSCVQPRDSPRFSLLLPTVVATVSRHRVSPPELGYPRNKLFYPPQCKMSLRWIKQLQPQGTI